MQSSPTLRRRFVRAGGRLVHYLRIGSGPPVLLIHSSPVNARYVVPHMRLLADRFTCIAFDSPGFGLSDALVGDDVSVRMLADALAENMEAIGLPPCPVFGTHTGAVIALSLAVHHPKRVTAMMLDGLPLFTNGEKESIFDDYFQPLQIDAVGGHYARTWTRFRDQYIWFPWTSRQPSNHNETDLGTPASIHAWVVSFFYSGHTYKPAYRAACFYGDDGYADAIAARCPIIYSATESDMLYPHLDRLSALPLPRQQTVRRIGNDRTQKDALIAEVFDRWPAASTLAPDRFALTDDDGDGDGVRQQFVDLDHGQVLLRHAGILGSEAILLLHDAPGSGQRLVPLIKALAATHLVLMPDLPGCGESDPLPTRSIALDAWADVLAEVCRQAGVEQLCIYGIGVGASIALRLAQRHPHLASAVVLRGLALPDPEERTEMRARYAPHLTIEADGSQWYRTWLMLRDQQIYFPWYERRAECLRRVGADFSADYLHRWTFEVMKQHAHYHAVIEAALADDAAATLVSVDLPVAVCCDPQIPFSAYDARVLALRPDATVLPPLAGPHALALSAFLQGVAA